MSPTKTIRRVLKRALDTETFRIITSDELLSMPTEEYQQIRRNVTIGVKTDALRYFCCRCGHPVYAPNYATGPGWKHFKDAPDDCEWWTGTPSTTDEVSARQFHGQQESPLHIKVKNLIANLLRTDNRITDVVVDEVLHGVTGHKKPDVRAEFGDRPIAIELQLSTTQIPIIVERELFYRQENRHLVWLTWDFEPCPYAEVRQAFRDIATAHNENLFTIDAETIAESHQRSCLVFRVLWWQDEVCHDKLITLDDLVWSQDGLPFAIERPKPIGIKPIPKRELWPEPGPKESSISPRWAEKFRDDWRHLAHSCPSWELSKSDLWLTLLELTNLEWLKHHPEKEGLVLDILNLALSFESGQPIASRQSNLAELLTTFLSAERRHPYARLAQKLAIASKHADLLERAAIQKKLETAMTVKQLGGSSEAVKILTVLFPQWVKQKADDQVDPGEIEHSSPPESGPERDDI